MKTIRLAFFSLLSLVFCLLTGCASNPVAKQDTKYIVVTPTSDMIRKCDISKPPAKSDYLGLSKELREKAMSEYSAKLLNDINLCNQRWDGLTVWFDEQTKLYGKK